MKHLAVAPHEVNPQEASRNLFETEEGQCYDNLADETLDRETVGQIVKQLREYADNLDDWLLRTCGAHPVLVSLSRGFEEPECSGGWHFVEDPCLSLGKAGDEWELFVECRYEHDDDRGGQFTQSGSFRVVDGRLVESYDKEDLADANDPEACDAALRDYFDSEGPG